MIISEQNKYIYLACPKTGTTSIENFLLKQDSTAFRNKIIIAEKLLTFKGHETAKKIKDKLKNDFNKYKVIGFVRHPYSRIVSSYFFYKNGKPLTKGKISNYKGNQFHSRSALMNSIKSVLSKTIPFHLWALIYPYKTNKEFFMDANNKNIVTHIGLFENLNEDLEQILKKLNLNFDVSELKKINTSNHDTVDTYFKNGLFRKIINLKIKEDLEFYNSIKKNNGN